MAQEDVRLSGTQLDSTGVAQEGLTVSLFAEGETTSAVATDTTDSNGEWDFTRTTPGRYDVQIVDGSETFRILARDKFQVTELTTRNPTTALPAVSAYSTTPIATETSSLVATFGFRPAQEASGVETADTPTDDIEGYINFTLSNDNATPQQWDAARITWIGTDVSATTEDADLEFETMVNGTLATALKIGVSGVSGSVVDNGDVATGSATLLATQGAIKAYVDAQVAAGDHVKYTDAEAIAAVEGESTLVLASGATVGGSPVVVDSDIGSTVQAYDADLAAIAALAKTDGNFVVANGSAWVAESGATARTSLGLGSLATLSTVNNDNWSGTGLSVANGGTGASTLTDHGVVLGSGTGVVSVTSAGTSGQVLTSNGAAADPTFQDAAGGGEATDEADMWRIHTAYSGDANPMTANWERVDNAEFNHLGTGMSQTSGVFTFPSTGYWMIHFHATFTSDNTTGTNLTQIQVTDDGSSYWSGGGQGYQAISATGQNSSVESHFMFDVTNTSTHKVRFATNVAGSNDTVGETTTNYTYATFVKIADT
jgi:hypothetical protein